MKTSLWFWFSSKTMEYLWLAVCTPLNEPEVHQPEFKHQSWTGRTWVKVNRENVEAQMTAPLFMGTGYMIYESLLRNKQRVFDAAHLCFCIDYSRGNLSQWTTTTLLQEIGGWRNIIHPEYLVQNDSSRISPRRYGIFVQTSSTESSPARKPPAQPKYLVQCPSLSRSLAVLAVLLGDIYVVALLHPLRPVSQKPWKMGRWTGKVTLFVGSHWWKIASRLLIFNYAINTAMHLPYIHPWSVTEPFYIIYRIYRTCWIDFFFWRWWADQFITFNLRWWYIQGPSQTRMRRSAPRLKMRCLDPKKSSKSLVIDLVTSSQNRYFVKGTLQWFLWFLFMLSFEMVSNSQYDILTLSLIRNYMA